MVGAKPLASTTISGIKLSAYDGALLFDPTEYRQVVVHSNTAISLAQILVMSSINYVSLFTILESLIGLLSNASSTT
jgi:hypothetical protein